MSVQCERCGDPAIGVEGATRVFCERCARIASTGARDSSELLFSLTPPPRQERESTDDLASLVRETARAEADQLGELLALAPPVLPSAPSARRRSWGSAVAIAAAMVVAVGSLAYAWRATRPVAAPAAKVERAAPPAAALERAEPARTEAPPLPSASAHPVAPAPLSEAPVTPALPPRESAVPRPIALHRRPGRLAAARALPDPTEHAPRAGTSQASMPRSARLPTRDDVRAAMDGVEGAIFQCAEGTHGLVQARVTFAGATGRVMHAEVVESTLPPSARSCIAVALRGARVRPFVQDRFIVAYPYRL